MGLSINKINQLKDGKVVIKCNSKEDNEILEKEILKKFTDKVRISSESLVQTKIKVLKI